MEAMFTILPNPLAMRSGANACAHQNAPLRLTDRKSTRLNSSHLVISYAVFCLKKKNQDVTHSVLVRVFGHRFILLLVVADATHPVPMSSTIWPESTLRAAPPSHKQFLYTCWLP